MAMKVTWYACSGSAADIHAYIKAARRKGFGEDLLSFNDNIHVIGAFFKVKVGQCRDFLKRNSHEVAGVIGKFVQDEKSVLAAIEDERRSIVSGFQDVREQALVIWLFRAFNVFHAPISM